MLENCRELILCSECNTPSTHYEKVQCEPQEKVDACVQVGPARFRFFGLLERAAVSDVFAFAKVPALCCVKR